MKYVPSTQLVWQSTWEYGKGKDKGKPEIDSNSFSSREHFVNHQSLILLFVTTRGWSFWKPSIQLRPPFVNFVFVIQFLNLDLVLSKQVAGCIGRFVGGGKTTLKSTCFALICPTTWRRHWRRLDHSGEAIKSKTISLWFDWSDLNIRKFVHYYDNMIGLLSKHKVHLMSEHSTVEISKASAVVFWPYLCLMFLEICVI